MKDTYQRINKIIAHYSITLNTFCEKLGLLSTATISKIIHEKRTPSQKTIGRIINAFPEISYDWLVNGAGEMLKASKVKTQPVNNDDLTVTSKQIIDFISTDIKKFIDSRIGMNTNNFNNKFLDVKDSILDEINMLIKQSHNNTLNTMKKLYTPKGVENLMNQVDIIKKKAIVTNNNFLKAHDNTVDKIDELKNKIIEISKTISEIETYNLLEEKRKEKINKK